MTKDAAKGLDDRLTKSDAWDHLPELCIYIVKHIPVLATVYYSFVAIAPFSAFRGVHRPQSQEEADISNELWSGLAGVKVSLQPITTVPLGEVAIAAPCLTGIQAGQGAWFWHELHIRR
jgi:hypothetical protein